MRIGSYLKTPAEVKRYSIEYADWLDEGEYIDDADFTASPVTVPPLQVSSVSIPASSTQVSFFVQGGEEGVSYVLDVVSTTSTGQVKEDTILFSVNNASRRS